MTGKIVGLLAQANAGKSTVAKMIRDEIQHVAEVNFADPLKEFAWEVFDIPHENLWGPSAKRAELIIDFAKEETWSYARKQKERFVPKWTQSVLGSSAHEKLQLLRERVNGWFEELRAESIGKGLTARRLLQTLGTECGRAVDADIWARYGVRRARNFVVTGGMHVAVIGDCRFQNELHLIKEAGGVIWRIKRDAKIDGDAAKHASETEQSSIPDSDCDRIIDNNGTLNDLTHAVRAAVQDLNPNALL